MAGSRAYAYDRTRGGTQEASVQRPQRRHSVCRETVKWGVRSHGTKARDYAGDVLPVVGVMCFQRRRRRR